jgi:thioredoxin reductase (NADPH)
MITGDMLRAVPLLAGVSDDELSTIARRAADIALQTNEWLIQEGELPAFFIVLSGQLTVYKSVAGVERAITEYGCSGRLRSRASGRPSLRAYAGSMLPTFAS